MKKKSIEELKVNYINVDNEVNFFIIPESMIKEIENSIIPSNYVYGVTIGCLSLALTFLKELLIKDLSMSIFTLFLIISIVSFCLAILAYIHLSKKRERQLESIRKIIKAKK